MGGERTVAAMAIAQLLEEDLFSLQQLLQMFCNPWNQAAFWAAGRKLVIFNAPGSSHHKGLFPGARENLREPPGHSPWTTSEPPGWGG